MRVHMRKSNTASIDTQEMYTATSAIMCECTCVIKCMRTCVIGSY